jgi:hypothetical protein
MIIGDERAALCDDRRRAIVGQTALRVLDRLTVPEVLCLLAVIYHWWSDPEAGNSAGGLLAHARLLAYGPGGQDGYWREALGLGG